MAVGRKTGGRAKGTPNRARAAAAPRDAAASAPGSAGLLPAIKTAFPKYRVVKLASLVPYANNARTHTPAQIDKLVASIREFGFTVPVLLDGKRGILAGHGRVLAARKLGMEQVPAIQLSHLTPAQRRAYVIADNRLALDAGWDESLLAVELGALRDAGMDGALTGFKPGELERLMAPPGMAAPEPLGKLSATTKAVCPGCGHEFRV